MIDMILFRTAVITYLDSKFNSFGLQTTSSCRRAMQVQVTTICLSVHALCESTGYTSHSPNFSDKCEIKYHNSLLQCRFL